MSQSAPTNPPAPAGRSPLEPKIPWYRELNRYHWWVLTLCVLGWMFDTMDQRLFLLARGDAMKELITNADINVEKSLERAKSDLTDAQGILDSTMESDPKWAEAKRKTDALPGRINELQRELAERARAASSMNEADKPASWFKRLLATKRPNESKSLVNQDVRDAAGRSATMWFIYGWATGGLFFGIMGDKWGRARTMIITILIYASFTAFSGFAVTAEQFYVFRFLTGLGVGGEFAAGVALLAEVIPERPRPYAIGLMQGLSAVGNITGSLAGKVQSYFNYSWNWLFFVGAAPALLVVLIRWTLKEPDTWVAAKAKALANPLHRMGSYWDLFKHPRWRKNAFIGVAIAIVGVTGLWGISFYTPELVTKVHEAEFARDHARLNLDENALPESVKAAEAKILKDNRSNMTIFQDIGAFVSMFGFAFLSDKIGRRRAFQLCCALALGSVILVFGLFNSPSQIWWMGILLGFGTLSLFGGYAIYFPELFPTRLRTTGVSFCYNVGRYGAGFLQFQFPKMIKNVVERRWTGLAAYRATNIALSSIYIVGFILMFFAPETKGKPLPQDDDGKTA